MDVTQKESIKEVVNFIEKADGKLNILVNKSSLSFLLRLFSD
jgi:short-subunit dehydrogenase involved in D-alanine esterification of teichoic acids